ncbi:MAG: hypothetical protein ACJ78Y_02890 [Myxococcales bacterium]
MSVTSDLKVDLRRTVADLRRLVYEIRQDVRVAGTDARKHWKAFLEPQISKSEELVRRLAQVTRSAMQAAAPAKAEGPRNAPARRRPRPASKPGRP